MPRKKHPKPTPIAIYSDEDYVVEVYEDGQLPKDRGLHGHYRKIQIDLLLTCSHKLDRPDLEIPGVGGSGKLPGEQRWRGVRQG